MPDLGYTAIGALDGNHQDALMNPVTAPEDGVLDSVSVYVTNNGNGPSRLAVYVGGASDTDPSGATLLEDLGTNDGTGWITQASVTNPTFTAGQRLWVCHKGGSAGSGYKYHYESSAAGDFNALARNVEGETGNDPTAAWPASISAAGSDRGRSYSAYLTYTAGAGGNAAISTLTDDYDDGTIDAVFTQHTAADGSLNETGGRLEGSIGPTDESAAWIQTGDDYTLEGSSIAVRLDASEINAVADAEVTLVVTSGLATNKNVPDTSGEVRLAIGMYNGMLWCDVRDGASLDLYTEIAAPDDVLWVRISESGGTITFEYASDVDGSVPTSWTTLDTFATANVSTGITDVAARLQTYNWETLGAAVVGYFDGLNTTADVLATTGAVTDGVVLSDSPVGSTDTTTAAASDGILLGISIDTAVATDFSDEGLVVGDSVGAALSAPLSEGALFGDSPAASQGHGESISEGLSLGDGLTVDLEVEAPAEGLLLGDTLVSVGGSTSETVTETITVGDSPAGERVVRVRGGAEEGLLLSDATTATINGWRPVPAPSGVWLEA